MDHPGQNDLREKVFLDGVSIPKAKSTSPGSIFYIFAAPEQMSQGTSVYLSGQNISGIYQVLLKHSVIVPKEAGVKRNDSERKSRLHTMVRLTKMGPLPDNGLGLPIFEVQVHKYQVPTFKEP